MRRRAASLIMTLMGDVVMPRGGSVWLTALIRLSQPLGLGERLVRTAVFRLREDGWLLARRDGRRALYTLTATGRDSTRDAERRIYHPAAARWTGGWHLVFTGSADIDAETRQLLRKRLRWLGFGTLAPNVYGHPVAPLGPARKLLAELGIGDQVHLMQARSLDDVGSSAARRMAEQCCDLGELDREYRQFNRRYAGFEKNLPGSDRECYLLRVDMIHDFRRILLRDPTLPDALLPDDWPGRRAADLCAGIYRRVFSAAERYVDDAAGDAGFGRFSNRYRNRFGGLDRSA